MNFIESDKIYDVKGVWLIMDLFQTLNRLGIEPYFDIREYSDSHGNNGVIKMSRGYDVCRVRWWK